MTLSRLQIKPVAHVTGEARSVRIHYYSVSAANIFAGTFILWVYRATRRDTASECRACFILLRFIYPRRRQVALRSVTPIRVNYLITHSNFYFLTRPNVTLKQINIFTRLRCVIGNITYFEMAFNWNFYTQPSWVFIYKKLWSSTFVLKRRLWRFKKLYRTFVLSTKLNYGYASLFKIYWRLN